MKKTILVVDDNAESIYLLRVLLEGQGMEVIAAQNGREALDRAHTLKPDLIITDILMPVMDGFELCRSVRKNEFLRDVPLIFYTATYMGSDDEDFARKIGADAFVVKPAEPEKLIAVVAEVMNRGAPRLAAPEETTAENADAFKLYNERLIKKLEMRMAELEAETKMRQDAEARFRSLYEESPIASFTWQKQKDEFILIDYNKAALQLTGGRVAEYRGVSAGKLYADRPEVLSDLNLCFNEKTAIKREVTSRNFLPGRFLCVHYGFIAPDMVVVQTEDRTEQKQAQEEVRRQQEMITRIFDHLPVMCAYFDEQGGIFKVNRSLEDTLGWRLAELKEMDLLEACYPDPAARKEALDWMLSGKTGWNDFRTRTRYGTVLDTSWAIVSFADGTYLIIGQDITARKQMERRLEEDRQELQRILTLAEQSRRALLSLAEDHRMALDRAEAALRELRESEGRYRLLFRSSPVGVFHYDLQLRLTDCNDRFVDILQSSRDRLIGLDLTNMRDKSVLPALSRALDGKEGVYEGPYRATTSEAVRSISLRSAPLWDHEGRIAGGMGIVMDVTERMRAQRVNEIRLKLFEYAVGHSLDELLVKTLDEICAHTQSPIGFFHFVDFDQQQLTLQSWSTRTTREFCRAEAKGMHYPIAQAGVWADAFRARKPVIHNDYASLPHRKGLPEGHAEVTREMVVPVMRGGLVVAILGVGNKPADYTAQEAEDMSYLADVIWTVIESKRLQEILTESEQRQKQYSQLMTTLILSEELFSGNSMENIRKVVVLSAPVLKTERTSVWFFDEDNSKLTCACVYNLSSDSISEGECLDASLFPAYTNYLQSRGIISVSDVFDDFRTREIPSDYYKAHGIHSLLDVPIWSAGKVKALLSFEHTRERRNWLPEEEQLAITLASFISYILEAEERAKKEQEIIKLNEELERRVVERTAQLEAVNRELEAFSYSVSHDLRAPLRSIDGFSQALLEDYADRPLDEAGRGYLARIRRATQQMGFLIDDMLKLSRVTRAAIRREHVDMSNIATKILDNFRQGSPGRQVELSVEPGVTAEGDPYLLEIALLNLLDNAWKFTGKTTAARVEFGFDVKDGEKIYFVRDNGAGFDMAYADKLFGAFQRLHTKEEFPGTGIGLATVRRIVNRHGGHIWAEGQVGKGATFYFTLP